MNNLYDNIPLIDLTAPKALSHNKTKRTLTKEIIAQNLEDAERILALAGFDINMRSYNVIEASDKYMVETPPDSTVTNLTRKSTGNTIKRGLQKPHYMRLLIFQDKLVFQAACCLPLRIFAASLDGNVVSGRVLFSNHSEEDGGKLAYEFTGTSIGRGTEMIIDLKRGESSKAQRLFFTL
jgi:hypothetical protein